MGETEFYNKRSIIEMSYFNNVQMILSESLTEYPSIYFYSLEMDSKIFILR